MEWVILIVVVAVLAVAILGFVASRRPRPEVPPGATAPVEAPPRRRTLAERLAKTRAATTARLSDLFQRNTLDDEFWTGLEETLIAADVGVATASEVVAAVKRDDPSDPAAARAALRQELAQVFTGRDRSLQRNAAPSVLMVVGVNGTGKTTSIAKLANMARSRGETVLLAAADTYRAAADQQLRTWADRVGVEVEGGEAGTDPAAVAYRAYHRAADTGTDLVIVDTAGRLHSNINLMDELGKVGRVLRREAGDVDEVLLVLDATTGQNGIPQARSFAEAVGVTGIILTKMDGTARGGVVAAVERDVGVPVKFIGVGEGMDDLVAFDPVAFVDAIIGEG